MPANSTLTAIRITERDLEVLDALADYRFLSAPQLAALYFPSKGAAETRLRRLHEHGLAVRVFMPARPYDRRTCTIYALGAKGSRLLAPRHDGHRPPFLSPQDQRSGLFLDHTLRRNDLRVCLQILHRNRPGFELTRWQQQREEVKAKAVIRTPRSPAATVTIVPDGVFEVAMNKRRECFAVEIDMGTVASSSMHLRYRAYWKWWRRGGPVDRYGPMPFRVLTLTTTERRLNALRRAAIAAPEDARRLPPSQRGSGLFWFALLDNADIAEPSRLLGPVWTVGRGEAGPPQRLLGA